MGSANGISPSACVSPSELTLTVEKVMEVMGEVKVGKWAGVGIRLGVPMNKLAEIQQQSSTGREKSRAVGEYWVQYVPHASWEGLATALYRSGEERAAVMAKQYLPKGMCISLPPQRVLWCLHSNGCTPVLTGSILYIWGWPRKFSRSDVLAG